MGQLLDKLKDIWTTAKEAIEFERALQSHLNEQFKKRYRANGLIDTPEKLPNKAYLSPDKYREYEERFGKEDAPIDLKTGKYIVQLW